MPTKIKQPEAITVRYELHELPTAQHKAGLAGLLLQIESMNQRRERGAKLGEPPRVVATGSTFAEVTFTSGSMGAMFNDLYAATRERIWVSGKWKNKQIIDERLVTDPNTSKSTKQYQYEIVQPRGEFLRTFTDGGKEHWLKLWRDAIWSTSRLKPKALEKKFGATAQGKASPDGREIWNQLIKHQTTDQNTRHSTVIIDTAVMLNTQAFSAETVKFLDRADWIILLHFWQLVVRINIPEIIATDGKRVFLGYTLAIPDISDLSEFCGAIKRSLSFLPPELAGFRPRSAVISLPPQGALDLMRSLDHLVPQKELGRRPPDFISAVEFFYYIDRDAKGKKLRDPKIATQGRIPVWDGLLRRYEAVISKGGPKNSLMLAGRLRALLDNVPWFSCLNDDLVEREWSWFVHSNKDGHRTPPAMMSFARDARRRFDQLSNQENTVPQTQSKGPEAVDRVIYRLVKNYVREKASARMGVSTSDRDAWYKATHDPTTGFERSGYQEERRHVAQGLFLALRSRHNDDFVEHFTATLGSVAQRLPEEDYTVLVTALMLPFTDAQGEQRPRTRDDVKTLTLLALSAHSRSLSTKSDEVDEPANDSDEE